jgi:hypothetical protein
MVAVDGEHGDGSEFGKAGQQVLQARSGSSHQLDVECFQELTAALGMKAVEERRAGQVFIEDFAGLLKEISAAGRLAQDSADPKLNEAVIVQWTASVNTADVVVEQVIDGTEQLVEQAGIVLWIQVKKRA